MLWLTNGYYNSPTNHCIRIIVNTLWSICGTYTYIYNLCIYICVDIVLSIIIYTSKHLYIHLYLYLSPISKRAISPQIACLAILAAHQVSANVVVKTAELVLAVRGRWWMTKRYPKSILKPDNYGWVKWDYEVPNIWKKIKFMFQTTNQLWLVTIIQLLSQYLFGSYSASTRIHLKSRW